MFALSLMAYLLLLVSLACPPLLLVSVPLAVWVTRTIMRRSGEARMIHEEQRARADHKARASAIRVFS